MQWLYRSRSYSTAYLPPQRLVLKTLPESRLSEVGDRPGDELIQYCIEDQNAIELAQEVLQYCIEDQDAIEPAQGTVPDCPPEGPDQLSSPLDRMDGGTPSDSAIDFSEYVDFSTHDGIWAGDCEYSLNTAAIEAKNIPFYHAHEATEAIKPVMGRHYRSNVEGGPLGSLQRMYKSARWCQWVEPSEGAQGEDKGVLFYRNRNGLGVVPQKMKAPKASLGGAKSGMIIGADD